MGEGEGEEGTEFLAAVKTMDEVRMYMYMCLCVCVYMYMCMCVCEAVPCCATRHAALRRGSLEWQLLLSSSNRKASL